MARISKYGNDTVDVLKKGCFGQYDTIACGRISFLVLIGSITLFFVVLKIIKYHTYKHSRIHNYLIFYLAAIQCILCIAGAVFGTRHPQLGFTTYYVKLLHFILICHLFWSTAAQNRHRDDIVQHVVNPVLGLYTLYLTTVILMGMVDISGTWTECLRPYWLMLSGADFTAVQFFAAIALYLTYDSRKSAISALVLPTVKFQTRDIWLITLAFEISAFASLAVDSLMILVGKEETGCSGVYNNSQIHYSIIIGIVTILKYLSPTWMLLSIFQPIRVMSRASEVRLTSHYNTDGTCENQYRRILFSPNVGLSTTLQYPTIPFSTDSPLYGSFGDFSYTDSLSDISPTIASRWGLEDNYYGALEKSIVEDEGAREKNSPTIVHNRRNEENNLDGKLINDQSDDSRLNGDLATINEESNNIVDSPHR